MSSSYASLLYLVVKFPYDTNVCAFQAKKKSAGDAGANGAASEVKSEEAKDDKKVCSLW